MTSLLFVCSLQSTRLSQQEAHDAVLQLPELNFLIDGRKEKESNRWPLQRQTELDILFPSNIERSPCKVIQL